MQTKIQKVLLDHFSPSHLEIENESDQHAGPPGRESHFKVLIVSESFQGMSRISRKREIFKALDDIMTQIHALALKVLSPEEFKLEAKNFQSPDCAHAPKKLK